MEFEEDEDDRLEATQKDELPKTHIFRDETSIYLKETDFDKM